MAAVEPPFFMAKRPSQPKIPVFKIKPIQVKRYPFKMPKLPNIKAGKIKI